MIPLHISCVVKQREIHLIFLYISLSQGHWDFLSSAENVNVQDSRGVFLDGCRNLRYNSRSSYGTDLVITDSDGSLDPDGIAQFGALVHDNNHVTDILGDACSPTAKCLAYCKDVCLRTFSLQVEQFGTENWKLELTGNGNTMQIPGTIYAKNEGHAQDDDRGRTFSASIPSGTYTAKFIDEGGNHAWPQYVEETWQKTPECSGHAVKEDLTVLKPNITADDCLELVRNGQVDSTTTDPWFHTFSDKGYSVSFRALHYMCHLHFIFDSDLIHITLILSSQIVVEPGMGANGTNAIRSINRNDKYSGVGQDLDSRCVELMKGELYEFNGEELILSWR